MLLTAKIAPQAKVRKVDEEGRAAACVTLPEHNVH